MVEKWKIDGKSFIIGEVFAMSVACITVYICVHVL